MPRFTLRDLFLSVTLIAAGVACRVLIYSMGWPQSLVGPQPAYAMTGLWLALEGISLALIGAGIGTPFHRRIEGITFACVTGVIWEFFFNH